MSEISLLKPERVFSYFEEISALPRGSGNMKKIADYCVEFAKNNLLRYVRDDADNVVIFKDSAPGYEDCEPIILQGHLDIVCQKEPDCEIDFLNDGLSLYVDGNFVKAKGTTLGADNGIAVAMILAILESKDFQHPPIEAVFTTDEEIGMVGASQLDMSVLKSKRMINLDGEEQDTLTVSCAGGSDFHLNIPLRREAKRATEITVSISGLKGGHSGVEINNGRVNADILAGKILNHMNNVSVFDLISINGGEKGNAIPDSCEIRLCTCDALTFERELEKYGQGLKAEISEREPDFRLGIKTGCESEFFVLTHKLSEELILFLSGVPNGVIEMSSEIEGLVETSLNLGILSTEDDRIYMNFTLRSNKNSELLQLEERLSEFCSCISCEIRVSGHYPPWEFKSDSALSEVYKKCFVEQFGVEPKVEAIHAGLECGTFAAKIDGLDCIAIGPEMFDVHTVNERLNIASTEQIYNLLLKILANC